jgi:hypothetical protein
MKKSNCGVIGNFSVSYTLFCGVSTRVVIPAGIAGIQKPWMAMLTLPQDIEQLHQLFFSCMSHCLRFFSHPCVLDSGNPCRNDGDMICVDTYMLCGKRYNKLTMNKNME